jgi:methyltransferase (TIGR00027 family)
MSQTAGHKPLVHRRFQYMMVKRTHDDAWDLATTVGATATLVAAARAAASRKPNPLVVDRYAEPLVKAVGIDFFSRLASGDLDFADVGGKARTGWMPVTWAVRTKFFDDFLHAATSEQHIRQVVILASGLDARACRLSWPAGVTIYEVDRPEVIEFKQATLSALGATPSAEVHPIGRDLRDDWRTTLRESGFDPGQPTAWVAEGLFIGFLSGDSQVRLIRDVTEVSAPGSRLAIDHLPGRAVALSEMMQTIGDDWRALGLTVDFGNLYFLGDRGDIEVELRARGWDVTSTSRVDLFEASGIDASQSAGTMPMRYATAGL